MWFHHKSLFINSFLRIFKAKWTIENFFTMTLTTNKYVCTQCILTYTKMIDSRKVATSCTPRSFVTPIFVLRGKNEPDFSAGVIRMVYCIRIDRRFWPLYERPATIYQVDAHFIILFVNTTSKTPLEKRQYFKVRLRKRPP